VSELDSVLCAGSVVVVGGRLLLVRRARPPDAGRWSLPGGRVEEGETLEEAARRETLEETALEVRIRHLLGTADIAGPTGRYLVCDFLAEPLAHDAVPRGGSDASEAAFVPLEDVLALDLVQGLGDWLVAHGVLAGDALRLD